MLAALEKYHRDVQPLLKCIAMDERLVDTFHDGLLSAHTLQPEAQSPSVKPAAARAKPSESHSMLSRGERLWRIREQMAEHMLRPLRGSGGIKARSKRRPHHLHHSQPLPQSTQPSVPTPPRPHNAPSQALPEQILATLQVILPGPLQPAATEAVDMVTQLASTFSPQIPMPEPPTPHTQLSLVVAYLARVIFCVQMRYPRECKVAGTCTGA